MMELEVDLHSERKATSCVEIAGVDALNEHTVACRDFWVVAKILGEGVEVVGCYPNRDSLNVLVLNRHIVAKCQHSVLG